MYLVRFPRRGLNVEYLVCYVESEGGRMSVTLERGHDWELEPEEASTMRAHLDELAPIGPPRRRDRGSTARLIGQPSDVEAPAGPPVDEAEGGA